MDKKWKISVFPVFTLKLGNYQIHVNYLPEAMKVLKITYKYYSFITKFMHENKNKNIKQKCLDS